jgi:hypothetical protein
MKRLFAAAGFVALASAMVMAGSNGTVTGEYVEARTAEVFAGGCIMNSEAETMGRQAILAWKIDRGTYQGVPLDGLAVVAAVDGDRNLGMREMGADEPTRVQAALVVDARANDAQRQALVTLARELSKGLVKEIVSVTPSSIAFRDEDDRVVVAADHVELTVSKKLVHDPSCGAMQWFKPLTTVEQASLGVAEAHSFSGNTLGAKWSHPNKRSAFFARFTY